MIPKIIHYCWFGKGPMPELAERCLQSWEDILKGYKIIRWDEENFNVNICDYVREAYEAKKYAFVTDYVRLYAMYYYGGIYMDTDVEVLQPLDSFLDNRAFSGFENEINIPTGIMACEKGYSCFGELLNEYADKHFLNEDGTYDLTTNVELITNYYLKRGLVQNNERQIVDGFLLMPSLTFCPPPEDIIPGNRDHIVTIHHKNGSWIPKELRPDKESKKYWCKIWMKRSIKRVIGRKKYEKMIRWLNRHRRIRTYNELHKGNKTKNHK
ncbi:MAG: glycosyl transferase [Lachnospiraceae bacterium]|nr:glycosyl transferase [Lachnospiraceae bacterium]